MRTGLKAAIAALGLFAMTTAASASEWTPPGPVKLMIAFAAGGGADTQARLIAEELEARTGWSFIPEEATGKGGLTMLASLKDQPADGTVIGMAVTEALGYNMRSADMGLTPSDFTGLTTTAGFQMGIVARADKGWTTFSDAVAAAKSDGALRFGVMSPKLDDIAYLLGRAQGIDLNIVSLKGGKEVLDAIVAGDVDLGFVAGIQSKGVAAGDLVNLASGLSAPLAQTPEAPTLADLGVTPFNADGYFVFVAPAGVPQDARDALARAIAEIVNDETTKAGGLVKKAFGGATTIMGAELDALMAADYESAAALMEAASQ
ncbi:Bug family tripartite tricarboxylate transporter substrate binding protein [Ruegeria marina]|uniref:Tripartite-type tricarboxylate transporter, receptor component TctC n=1 Tax=Ruegeria marina TaxID=639004 RepID=A0A1G6VUU0_9RHOB|nr:tripartite tricarboxylate transporter substrate-binding protein [Ruegeria marina]SDD57341.1 Tripartite-type tricarboxylate transporter, receptor component TctC [Ruegeria marina]